MCGDCKAVMIDLLEKRMRRIFEVSREEAEAQGVPRDKYERSDADFGQSCCFHMMELIAILEGKTTCGVYDDYGEPPTIKGPQSSAKGRAINGANAA